MTQELMTPEEAQRLREQIAQAVEPLARALADVAATIASAFRAHLDAVWDSLMPRCPPAVRILAALQLIPRKWLRIYRHTKKRRIRKKYEKRILAALAAAL